MRLGVKVVHSWSKNTKVKRTWRPFGLHFIHFIGCRAQFTSLAISLFQQNWQNLCGIFFFFFFRVHLQLLIRDYSTFNQRLITIYVRQNLRAYQIEPVQPYRYQDIDLGQTSGLIYVGIYFAQSLILFQPKKKKKKKPNFVYQKIHLQLLQNF